ncbi:septation protein SepH [Natronoglycomyces albus]|uniref:DUF3071 domain-containing protein n=1 Tax=Natronoglycomyces albus TaxID=2811108 RepID=A0A895XK95_9ACTN|nr:septation protein SepH [Natronoglycomyces albus]QSB05467.1 DUF3071 domain-containing protein [Natronoglycomyces albus]
MRPVRFVALSEDGQALVLADELGRLLALPLDERISSAVDDKLGSGTSASSSPTKADQAGGTSAGEGSSAKPISLSPRDIQTRIRTGESAEDIARSAGVQVDRVLRYAGPVLQERAMLAQAARRARLATSERGERMSTIVDAKLGTHGVDPESVSWDAWRLEDGSWRIQASWASGKSTAMARWQLDRSRQSVSPDDEMAQFLSTPAPQANEDDSDSVSVDRLDTGRTSAPRARTRPTSSPARPSRDPLHGVTGGSDSTADAEGDPLRRDRLREVLERPLDDGGRAEKKTAPLGLPGTSVPEPKDTPEVPSLAVLRPASRVGSSEPHTDEQPDMDDGLPLAASGAASGARSASSSRPRNRLPAWDDVLFGSATSSRSE